MNKDAPSTIKVIHLEDSGRDAELVKDYLSSELPMIDVKCVTNKSDYLASLAEECFDLILSDFKLPGFDGFEALVAAHELCPLVPFICLSGTIGEEAAVELLTSGAVDYVLKDRIQRLPMAITKAIDMARIKADNIQANEELKDSEELFNSIANSTPGLMWMSGVDMGFTWFNQAWLNFTGREMWQEKNLGWSENIHPDDKEPCLVIYKGAFFKRESFIMEFRIKHKDGDYRWIMDKGQPRYDRKGEFCGFIGSCLDISQRRSDEQKIQNLNRVYSVLSDINQSIVRLRDEAQILQKACEISVKKGRFQMSFLCLTKPGSEPTKDSVYYYKDDSLKGLPDDELYKFVSFMCKLDICNHKEFQLVNNIQEDKRFINFQRQLKMANVQSFATFPLILDEKTIGIYCLLASELGFFTPDETKLLEELAMDISLALEIISIEADRKEKENVIVQLNASLEKRVSERTAQLQTLYTEMESFSYTVSHDLRSPLRSISGFASILLEDYQDVLDDMGRSYLNRIMSGVVNMDKLIEGLLRLSKSGMQELVISTLDMYKLANVSYNELLSNNDGIQYEFNLPKLPYVMGDEALVKQVWMNLLSNAMKYSSKVQRPQITIGSSEDEKSVTYYIRDNGSGFESGLVNKLFNVFSRLHKSEDFSGTGLGLANVKKIITRHGGLVWAEGDVNKGATFYFKLNKQWENQ
jgi:PAS domain S-box-containing protein